MALATAELPIARHRRPNHRRALALGALAVRSSAAEAALVGARERLAGKLDDPSLANL